MATRIAGLTCPDCGAEQSIYTHAGTKSRIRPAHYFEACPNCQARLHMVHTEGGQFREGLYWGLAAVILFAVAIFALEVDMALSEGALWAIMIGAIAGLYVFAVAVTGFIVGRTRRMMKA
ncbi:hypothetical protein ATO6_17615 [Oceanicola sp. 22II-s10i]|nr:hypothetical protein ATO6_17615 [Oceanicola sp. 22II-s10i]